MMKKVWCILLSVLLAAMTVIPVCAGTNVNETRSQIPVIRISGDGEPLYNAEGERIMHFRGLLETDSNEENEEDNKIMDAAINILMPFLREGILFNKWDNYYAALEKEIGEMFGDALLDCNGEPIPGTGLSQSKLAQVENLKKTDKKSARAIIRTTITGLIMTGDWTRLPLRMIFMNSWKPSSKPRKMKRSASFPAVWAPRSCLHTSQNTAWIPYTALPLTVVSAMARRHSVNASAANLPSTERPLNGC